MEISACKVDTAFRQEHIAFVDRILARRGVRGEDARDVRQDVFLLAHRAAGEFRGDARLDTWLYRITVREVARHRRKLKTRRAYGRDDGEAPVAPTQLHDVLRGETREELHQVLSRMDSAKRRALELHVLEELPMREVAAQLGCPLQTAYSRLNAAYSQAAALLERHTPAGPLDLRYRELLRPSREAMLTSP